MLKPLATSLLTLCLASPCLAAPYDPSATKPIGSFESGSTINFVFSQQHDRFEIWLTKTPICKPTKDSKTLAIYNTGDDLCHIHYKTFLQHAGLVLKN